MKLWRFWRDASLWQTDGRADRHERVYRIAYSALTSRRATIMHRIVTNLFAWRQHLDTDAVKWRRRQCIFNTLKPTHAEFRWRLLCTEHCRDPSVHLSVTRMPPAQNDAVGAMVAGCAEHLKRVWKTANSCEQNVIAKPMFIKQNIA